MKSTSVSFNNNSRSLTSTLPTEIVQAYGTFIQEYVDDLGWDGYWVTFMFRNISRSEERKIEQMHHFALIVKPGVEARNRPLRPVSDRVDHRLRASLVVQTQSRREHRNDSKKDALHLIIPMAGPKVPFPCYHLSPARAPRPGRWQPR
jgi:hypothetical protein